jgi:hypothetical protein
VDATIVLFAVHVQVLAYTAAGDGQFSTPVTCSTEEDGQYEFNNSFLKINRGDRKKAVLTDPDPLISCMDPDPSIIKPK